ncbi:MAG TPA: N-acetylmuramoyl-L-alanine amidase, partial [Planctomycetota bacterium]|nr:N-acetylmuramoyl-L-alanine amidase [Planctomycetota bacterium]
MRPLSAAAVALLAACRSVPPEVAPRAEPAGRAQPPIAYAIPPWARHLKGVRVAIDPGHGGDADRPGYKRGPTGVREAEANLRVGLALAGMLEAAGAIPVLTRREDRDVSLVERARIAEREGCDLFLSIHHNAISDPSRNFGTVWVHADPDHSPASLDLAWSIHREVNRILDLPQSADCPILSDRLMYERGFAVLREASMPAVLSEASFHTNPEEERRLSDPEYNRREAYGHFLGLARHAEGGLPRASLLAPRVGPADPVLRVALDDGLQARKGWGSDRPRILEGSISVRVDGLPVPHDYDGVAGRISVDASGLGSGMHSLDLRFENVFKHSNH